MKAKLRFGTTILTWTCLALLAACNGNEGAIDPQPGAAVPPDTAQIDPVNPKPTPAPTVPPSGSPAYSTAILLYNGTGVSTSDWQSTENIVRSMGLSYQLVNSATMNTMSLEEMAAFGAIIVPGGSGGTITSNLTTETRLRIRHAVREHGVGYVGFCAGAWVAVGPEAETTRVASYGLAVAKGSVLDIFYPNGQLPTAAMVPVTLSDGTLRQLVWWGGPITPEWQDGVIGRYSTGEPAISQTFAGKGLVLITGPHPEAPQGWRATAGTDTDGLDFELTEQLIDAALTKIPLPTF